MKGIDSIVRTLTAADQPALERFLTGRLADSMFLLGNSRLVGLVDQGRRYEGTYVGAWERGELVAVIAHYWNGNLIVQAPQRLPELLAALPPLLPRPIAGVLGPAAQVAPIVNWLNPPPAKVQLNSHEYLYELPLADLVVPAALALGRVKARRAQPADTVQLTEWRAAFSVESLSQAATPELFRASRRGVEASLGQGTLWVLEADDQLVAMTDFNATIREAVQVGGVWTPPEFRQRGYARAAVAASLQDARAAGVQLGILFTDQNNIPAQRAYEAIGFRRIGDFRILLLHS